MSLLADDSRLAPELFPIYVGHFTYVSHKTRNSHKVLHPNRCHLPGFFTNFARESENVELAGEFDIWRRFRS